jgi:hypothetical protein
VVEALASFHNEPEPLDDEQMAELEERNLALTELTRHPGWEALVQSANEEIAKHRRLVLGGQLEPTDYVRQTGWIAGAEFFLDIPAFIAELHNDERMRADAARADEAEDDLPEGHPIIGE